MCTAAPGHDPDRPPAPGHDPEDRPPAPGHDPVAAALSRLLLTNPSLTPAPRAPSPLLSPGEVARAVLAALQRMDYPSPSAGASTAFAFTLPADTGGAAPLTPGAGRRGKDWGSGAWRLFEEWEGTLLRDDGPARLVIGAGEVSICGPPRLSDDGAAAVPFTVVRHVDGRREESALELRLSAVEDHGPWRGCYLVSGLRKL